MRNDASELIDVVQLQSLQAKRDELGVLDATMEQVRALSEALESVDNEPILTPKNLEVLVPEIVKMSLELTAIVIDSALCGFREIIESRLL